jgi:hypothetical protein
LSLVRYDTNIDSNVISKVNSVENALSSIRDTFRFIDTKLSDNTKWAGLAHEKCVEAHEAVKEYEKLINPVCFRLRILLTKLDIDVSGFTV